MKELLLSAAILLLSAVSAFADGSHKLVVRSSSGVEREFNTDGMSVRFVDGKMLVSNTQVSDSFPVESLDRMYLAAGQAGVSELTEDSLDSQAAVFSVAGILIGNYATLREALSQLSADVYIIVQDNRTFKLIVK